MNASLAFVRLNRRWLAAGFLLLFASSFGQSFFVSLSGGEIRRAFALSNGDFGLLYMGVTLAGALALAFVGPVVDRWSARWSAMLAVWALALGALLLALAPGPVALAAALFFLRLFGQGFCVHAAYTLLGRWFGPGRAEGRGRAVSLASLGLNAGQAVLPPIFAFAMAPLGWRGVWGAVAALLVLLAVPLAAVLFTRERRPAEAPGGSEAMAGWTRREALRDPLFPLLLLAMLPPAFISNTILFHQAYLGELRGWSPGLFASALPLYALTTLGSLLLAGWCVDKRSARAFLPLYLLPLGLGCLVLGQVEGPRAAFLFLVLYGLSDGFSLTLLGTLWPEVYGTRHLGAIRSAIVPLMVLAAALGPGLGGVLIDRGVSYPLILTLLGLYCLAVSALMVPVVRRLKRRALEPQSGSSRPVLAD
ncbi:MFS transporter [Aureimonas sp. AU40]|uniref:MFS transporter n=1 Tax=Aureimonas sp. AU40 TaxID=1637747 RepID=UPI000781C3CB|nr:MFS transporter [Aureimonas sp. AU40]